jgi:ABC-type multidrug transport system fused ATPase/permease subunit
VSSFVTALVWLSAPPMQIVIALTFLYRLLGISAFAGLATLVLAWPINHWVTKQSLAIQKGTLAARDKRMGVVNELIGAIKFIVSPVSTAACDQKLTERQKFFAWEDRWIDRALDARAAELRWMLKARTNNIVFSAIWAIAPSLVSLTSFATFVTLGGKLDVATAFTALALFGMVSQPLNLVPMMVVQTLQSLVALNRIAVYLAEDEVTPQVSSLKREGRPTTAELEEGLGFESASFKWNEVQEKEEDKDKKGKKKGKKREPSPPASEVTATENLQPAFELRDLSIRFPEGKLTVVTGPTASGKTALLVRPLYLSVFCHSFPLQMALLGEMTLIGGKLVMAKDPAAVDPASGLIYGISYAAQSPWLRHQSIKDNILFGQPLDEERYEAVIEACALRTDLRILEDGDATEIGAR